MIIQVILTLCFVAVAIYGWAQISSVRLISRSLMLLSLAAMFFVWNPDLANRLAHAFGIGRGADLMVYFFFVFVIFQLATIHVKLHTQMTLLAQLARRIAIDGAGPQAHRDR